MGINSRDYVRDDRRGWSASGGWGTPGCRWIIVANIVVFVLQIVSTRPTQMLVDGEMFVRRVVACHYHGSRSFPVQTVHDARTQRTARAGKLSQAVQERVHQRAACVARAGVYHHPGGLVHDYEIVVDKKQFEG